MKVAYGNKNDIDKAIVDGSIPPSSLVITKDTQELFFVDPEKKLFAVKGGSKAVIVTKDTHFEFPIQGQEIALYIAKKENKGRGLIYRWDNAAHKYFVPVEDMENIEINIITGGNAFDWEE